MARMPNPVKDADEVPYPTKLDRFLIEDFLPRRMTILAGAPTASKSSLTVAIVKALLQETDFLGYKVTHRPTRVLFVVTDPDADEAIRERLGRDFKSHGRVGIMPVRKRDLRANPNFWQEAAEACKEEGYNLVVIDHILGVMLQKVSEAEGAGDFLEQMEVFADNGIDLLLVTHTPKGNGDGLSPLDSPIGGRAFGAVPRGVMSLMRSRKDGIRLHIDNNHSDSVHLYLKLNFVRGVPVYTVSEPSEERKERKRKRTEERLDEWEALRIRVLAEQPEGVKSLNALATHCVRQGYTSRSVETVRKRLKDMIELRGGRWVSLAAEVIRVA